ncbi:nucleotidyltransferase domain-containing protein [Planococcus sp. CAU13]|uniref:nucleotidyltransferase domain-containing protein n=1 Tax=Planococcus sp. CAU13 TaxID=1541197 RepID=UPI0009DF13CC|nr:hypothetical protein [Planococcus sp. CAU13]
MTDAQTQTQLEVLTEICLLTDQLELEFWLRGGWAIDFLLGKISRPHGDIDLITWIQNRDLFEKNFPKQAINDCLSNSCSRIDSRIFAKTK